MKILETIGLKEKEIPRGAPDGAKKIDFDEILEILKGVYRKNKNKTQYPTTDNANESSYYDEAKEIFKKAGLENNVEIINVFHEPKESVKENNSDWKDDCHIMHHVVIRNLSILVKEKRVIKPHPYFSGGITFQNNTFSCPKDDKYKGGYIVYEAVKSKGSHVNFSFHLHNNKFENVGIWYEAKPEIGNYAQLINNIFLADPTVRFAASTVKIDYDYERALDYYNKVGSIQALITKPSILIMNNEIPSINFNINAPISFKGRNIINDIHPNQTSESNQTSIGQSIEWGRYQKIIHTIENNKRHKSFFIALKKIAAEDDDKSQNFVLNREILKCDHFNIKNEETPDSWQDRLILWFGDNVSDHGISLVRPFSLLLVINTIFTFFSIPIILYEGFDIGFLQWLLKLLYIWFEMLNPVSSLSNSTGIKDNIAISFFNAIQKGIFALLLYELIRVGRRFVAK